MEGVTEGQASGAFDRTISLVGSAAFEKLKTASVLVVGLGGVGGAAAEILVRSGIGRLTFMDGDVFEPSNLNRQILCTLDSIGKPKAEVAKERAQAVNPDVQARAVCEFFDARTENDILCENFDYCIDAIDDAQAKVRLVVGCQSRSIPIVSAMGAGNRTDCDFAVRDIYATSGDPFARRLRKMFRDASVQTLNTVCAVTPPAVRSATPLSMSAPPFVMGAMLANFAIGRLMNDD